MTLAQQLIEWAGDELTSMGLEGEERDLAWKVLSKQFLKQMRQKVKAKEEKPVDPTEMDWHDAQHFERRTFPPQFKAHAGEKVYDVPLEYLTYLTDDSSFIRDLKRYVKSARFRQRMKTEGGDE